MNRLIDLHMGDALDKMRILARGAVRLWITSPPYEDARTYGRGHKRRGEAWVKWYRPFVVEMARAGNLVAVNMSARVRDHRYSGAVEMLVADLIRLDGLCVGPSPYAWVKSSGIPGSGREHYHRRNWEPVYVFARPECLPPAVSNNLAFGEAPKWGPGGSMSHRVSSGKRVNQWGGGPKGGGSRRKQGHRQKPGRPSHEFGPIGWAPRGNAGQTLDLKSVKAYLPPAVSNPGNVLYTTEAGKLTLAGDVIYTINGGGNIGNEVAHENEAPMNLALAERFVLWYSGPGDLIGDPMCGSGTTGEAALKWGRRFWGCDERQSEVDRTYRRLAGVRSVGESPPAVTIAGRIKG